MRKTKAKKASGYDKYVDWKIFIVPVVLFFTILILPTPRGMRAVGTLYQVGPKAVVNHITRQLFDETSSDVLQWQLLRARAKITSHFMRRSIPPGCVAKA